MWFLMIYVRLDQTGREAAQIAFEDAIYIVDKSMTSICNVH